MTPADLKLKKKSPYPKEVPHTKTRTTRPPSQGGGQYQTTKLPAPPRGGRGLRGASLTTRQSSKCPPKATLPDKTTDDLCVNTKSRTEWKAALPKPTFTRVARQTAHVDVGRRRGNHAAPPPGSQYVTPLSGTFTPCCNTASA